MKVHHETSRLLIGEAVLMDAHFIFELMNSPGWLQYIGDRGIKTLKDAENYIRQSLIDNYKKQGFGLYKICLKIDSTPIGLCGFLQRDYLDAPDIGFAILPKHEGKGYMYEAAKTMLSESKFEKLYAITSLENIRSARLLNKLGLSYENNISPNGTELKLFVLSNA